MDCPLERIADSWWLCPACGWLYYGERAPRRNCPKARERIVAEIDRLLAMPGVTGDDAETPKNAEVDRLCSDLLTWEMRGTKAGCGKGEARSRTEVGLAMEKRLLHAIDEAVSNGLATRSSGEIGRVLVVCQRCPEYRGDYCDEDQPDGKTCTRRAAQVFLMRLTRARLVCDRWDKERTDGSEN